MKTIVIKICAFALILALALGITACDVQLNSYSAKMLVRSSSGGTYKMKFESFKGRVSQSVKNPRDADGAFICTASLDEGEITVSYTTPLTRESQPLFTLKGGESIEGERLGYLTNGERARITVESDSGAKGGKIEITIVR